MAKQIQLRVGVWGLGDVFKFRALKKKSRFHPFLYGFTRRNCRKMTNYKIILAGNFDRGAI